jgi:hypothetical protein
VAATNRNEDLSFVPYVSAPFTALPAVYTLVQFAGVTNYVAATAEPKDHAACLDLNLPCWDASALFPIPLEESTEKASVGSRRCANKGEGRALCMAVCASCACMCMCVTPTPLRPLQVQCLWVVQGKHRQLSGEAGLRRALLRCVQHLHVVVFPCATKREGERAGGGESRTMCRKQHKMPLPPFGSHHTSILMSNPACCRH